uniref:Uncharacterized protein n=1 Tax=Aegilops tauschii subsp. strangulata TaxID=200361 RepID=A0A453JBF8_AEGTS
PHISSASLMAPTLPLLVFPAAPCNFLIFPLSDPLACHSKTTLASPLITFGYWSMRESSSSNSSTFFHNKVFRLSRVDSRWSRNQEVTTQGSHSELPAFALTALSSRISHTCKISTQVHESREDVNATVNNSQKK